MLTIEILFRYLGQLVVYGGGAVAIAYAVFRILALKWLDSRFAEKLEAFKHLQAKEMEEVKFRINFLFDRAKKLNEKEYEVLPEAWGRLNDAFWKASATVSLLQSYPDLEKMSDAHFAEFLGTCRLQEWEKQELRESKTRNAYYQQHIFWHDLSDAKTASRECHRYLSRNGIFLKSEVKDRFVLLDSLVWSALVDREVLEQIKPHREPNTAVDRLRREGEGMLKELEAIVQGRMHE
ncbi:MAG: hypothetical protein AW07_03866 [Candidatus Accumulibacter sp. SK-11]|nr:MAG: hypothetical protein AW07_03866 [Candidatus Accumulibacter sp. SK-11]HRL77452.1 hypothetical protein [Candidatus Accumulibacter phosphatis]